MKLPILEQAVNMEIGVILLCGIAIFTTLFLLWRTQIKRAAVGRRYGYQIRLTLESLMVAHREMQIFLVGYVLIEICEIFTIGGFPLKKNIRIV